MISFHEQLFFWFYHFAHQSVFGDQVIVFFAERFPLMLLIGITLGTIVYGFRRHIQSGKLICLRCYEHFVIIVGVALFARLLAEVVKVLAHAARPFITFAGKVVPLVQESGFSSFPSGHATLMFALALGVYSYNRTWGSVMFVLAFLIGVVRIMAGVHYPFDILMGALLGLFISGIVVLWDKSMLFPSA